MKGLRYVHLVMAFLATISVAAASQDIDLKTVLSGAYSPKNVPGYQSVGDGNDYIMPTNGNTMIVRYSYKSGSPVDTLFNVSTARECPFKKFDGYILSPDETQLMLYTNQQSIYRRSFKAKYYTFEIRRKLVKALSSGFQQAPLFSPNSRMVAFVRDNNIFLKKLDYGTESQITKDGVKNKIINGVPDWVYEEEFSMNQAMTWSEDNATLAYIKFDESNVKEYALPTYRGLKPSFDSCYFYPQAFSYKYPVAGEINSSVSVYTFQVENKVTKKMNLQVESSDYIPRIRFTAVNNQLMVMTLNRYQNLFRLHRANAASGVCKVILQDQNEAYINPDNMDLLKFYPDFFVFVSEKSGYRHLYQYAWTGTLMRQITSGNWDVTDFYGYDPQTKNFFFQAAKKSPLQREVYAMDVKGRLLNLAVENGINAAHFSKNFKYFQLYFNNAQTPLCVTINNTKGATVRTIEKNEILNKKLKDINLATKEFFQFQIPSGEKLNGYMMKPSQLVTGKKYPVLMIQYSGPGSQQVLDKWNLDWTQCLTQEGFIVVCVDGRGTGSRGAQFERTTYQSLGLKESADQIAAAHYLSTLPFVDGSRIGIWGWSFGGYNVLMSMTGSDAFKVGIAVAPVTDWRFYDSIYTERYMRTPKENHDGYEASSAMARADKLKGRLLVIVGSADDNVHPQNTYEFTEVLVQNDIPFDMHVYTNRNHSIYGGNTRNHLFQKMINYLHQNL